MPFMAISNSRIDLSMLAVLKSKRVSIESSRRQKAARIMPGKCCDVQQRPCHTCPVDSPVPLLR